MSVEGRRLLRDLTQMWGDMLCLPFRAIDSDSA